MDSIIFKKSVVLDILGVIKEKEEEVAMLKESYDSYDGHPSVSSFYLKCIDDCNHVIDSLRFALLSIDESN